MNSNFQNEDNYASTELPSSVWKIINGKNGDKYITFHDRTVNSSANLINSGRNNASNQVIKVYKMRWYILSVICFANISNAINWISFSPIADYTGQFYTTDFDHVNYLSLIYLITSTPAGFFSFWLIDSFGVRLSLNLGSWINLIGALIRLVSALDSADGKAFIPQSSKYIVLMVGQFCCSLAQPFILFVSTKFATNWFASDQRSLANTIALGSNTFGMLIGAFISPLIVNSAIKFVSEMCFFHLVTSCISLLPALMACFITRSTPPTPPSYSEVMDGQESFNNEEDNDQLIGERKSFYNDFKIYLGQISKLATSRDFIVLFFCFGISLGIFNAFTTLIEQIMCTRGYTDDDAGYLTAAMIVSGLVGSVISGIIIDKTKRFEELSKICFNFAGIFLIASTICFQWNNDKSTIYYLMILTFCGFGFFGLPLLPICMDMSVECVYPIPEATTTGLLFISGQLFGILFILTYPKFAQTVDMNSYVYHDIQQCTVNSNQPSNSSITSTSAPSSTTLSVLDYTYALYGQTILFVVMTIGFIVSFKCAYLRLRSEREKLAEKILRSAANN